MPTGNQSFLMFNRRYIMTEMFTEIFQNIQKDIQKNLKAVENYQLPASSTSENLQGSGTITVPFHLDGNGNYHYGIEKYGAGVTIHFKAKIKFPEATYSITINSSDGGGGHWENVKVGLDLSCDVHTSFWHNTKITVDIHADVVNVDGEASIDYNY
jgi:hypothetical protein